MSALGHMKERVRGSKTRHRPLGETAPIQVGIYLGNFYAALLSDMYSLHGCPKHSNGESVHQHL
jgi:hypothetical protein